LASSITARNAAPSIPNATREELNTLRLQLEDLTEHSLTLEKERDFYFAKVSHIGLRLGEEDSLKRPSF